VIDLHCHSTVSDGTDTPTELVEIAGAAGLTAVAITDHDTLDHVDEGSRAGAAHGVRVVPACELSCATPAGVGTMHLLVYFPDVRGALAETLVDLRRARDERNVHIVDRLRDAGVDITLDNVAREAGDGTVGRPHVAAAMMRAGYVDSIDEAFDRWLARGRPAYVERARLSPPEAIRLAHEAGAATSLAHPGSLDLGGDELDGFVGALVDDGLDALECEYARYSPDERVAYRTIAERHGLLPTGGSDYHGAYKPDLRLGTGRGDLAVPDEWLDALDARRPR
jgi:predicted metal-dependent phosphoesterase TrpH